MEREVHLGVNGLVVGDLSLRLYDGSTPISASAITLTPLATGIDYTLGGLLEIVDSSSGNGFTLTAETPAGVYHAWRWGKADDQPRQVIVPIRESGHTLSSLGVKVFRDGVEFTTGLSLTELGSPGDYNLSTLPVSVYGERWSVRWIFNGVVYFHSWIGNVITITDGTRTFLEINALQSPFGIGNDSSARAMLSFNILCDHIGVPGAIEREICKLIQNEGLATLGTDMFFGSLVQLPQTGAGPFVSVNAGGGLSSLITHNNNKRTRPSVQIIVRAGTIGGVSGYVTAQNKANAIHALLDGKHNINVTL